MDTVGDIAGLIAAIGDYRGNGNAAYGNDYSGIRPGARAPTTRP